MRRTLTHEDITALRALASRASIPISSNHRVRLEMLGLVRDSPHGLMLTEAGRLASREAPAVTGGPAEAVPALQPERDSSGRRASNRRLNSF